jgi:hypothetical protein
VTKPPPARLAANLNAPARVVQAVATERPEVIAGISRAMEIGLGPIAGLCGIHLSRVILGRTGARAVDARLVPHG